MNEMLWCDVGSSPTRRRETDGDSPKIMRPATDAEMLKHYRRARKLVWGWRLPARVINATMTVGLSDERLYAL
jgi:hypothetical protein